MWCDAPTATESRRTDVNRLGSGHVLADPREPITLTPEQLEVWDDLSIPLFNTAPEPNTPPCTPDGRTAK